MTMQAFVRTRLRYVLSIVTLPLTGVLIILVKNMWALGDAWLYIHGFFSGVVLLQLIYARRHARIYEDAARLRKQCENIRYYSEGIIKRGVQ